MQFQEEIVQGKPLDFYQINQNQQTGQYNQQKVDVNLIPQQQYLQQQNGNYNNQPIQQQNVYYNQQSQQQQQQNNQANQIQCQPLYFFFDNPQVKTQDEQQQQNQKFQSQELKIDEETKTKYIVHIITPADTLIGLSIRYNVSEHRIKVFNNLDSDEVWFKKEIKIPNPTTNIQNEQDDQNIDEIVKRQTIAQFKFHILQPKDQSEKMAHYYLSEADWDIVVAEKLYKEDLDWENQSAQQGNNHKVGYQQLINKKNN